MMNELLAGALPMKGGGWPDGRGQRGGESHLHPYFMAIARGTVCLQTETRQNILRVEDGEREGQERERGMGGDERDDMHKQN